MTIGSNERHEKPHRPNSGLSVIWSALLIAAGTWTTAQPAHAFEKRPVFVTASFLDRNDRFIENLQQNEVEILEDGQARQIEFMAGDELPSVYGIIFDRAMLPEAPERERSGFQSRSNATSARDIAYELIDKLLARQTIWVGAYDQSLQVVFDAAADGFGAKNAIGQIRGRRSQTPSYLFSALASAVTKMNQRHEKRRVLIVFLEEVDSETAGRMKLIKNLLASSNVELFSISYASRLGAPGGIPSALNTSLLRELTQVTAGQAFASLDFRDHPEDVVRRLTSHMRTLYTFGFHSESGLDKPGKLTIKCSRQNSKVKHHPTVPNLE
jgi:hypothetical protein